MSDWLVSALTIAAFTSIGVGAAYPQFAHLLDSGSDECSVEQLPTKKVSSRNVKVSGIVRDDIGIELTTTTKRKKYSESHSELFFPFVTQSWVEKQPVHVVVEVSDRNQLRTLLENGRAVTVQGTLRNAGWEHVPTKVREALVAKGQLLADDLVWLQMGRPHDVERALGYPLVGVIVGVMTVLAARSKKKSPAA